MLEHQLAYYIAAFIDVASRSHSACTACSIQESHNEQGSRRVMGASQHLTVHESHIQQHGQIPLQAGGAFPAKAGACRRT